MLRWERYREDDPDLYPQDTYPDGRKPTEEELQTIETCLEDLAYRHYNLPTDEGPFLVCQLPPDVSFMSLVDYFPGVPFATLGNFLIIEMATPSKVHEVGTGRLLVMIQNALQRLHPELPVGSPSISNNGKMTKMRLDTEWVIPNGALWAWDSNGVERSVPNLVIECSVTERLQHACEKAEAYLKKTDTKSGVLIALVLNVKASLHKPSRNDDYEIIAFSRREEHVEVFQNVTFGKVSGPQQAILKLPTRDLLHGPKQHDEYLQIDLYNLKVGMDEALRRDRLDRSST